MTTSQPTHTDHLIAEFEALYSCYCGYDTTADDDWRAEIIQRADPAELARAIKVLRIRAATMPDDVRCGVVTVPTSRHRLLKTSEQYATDLWPAMVDESRDYTRRIYRSLDDARAAISDARRALSETPGVVESGGYIVAALAEQDMTADGEIADMITQLGRIQTELARLDGRAGVGATSPHR